MHVISSDKLKWNKIKTSKQIWIFKSKLTQILLLSFNSTMNKLAYWHKRQQKERRSILYFESIKHFKGVWWKSNGTLNGRPQESMKYSAGLISRSNLRWQSWHLINWCYSQLIVTQHCQSEAWLTIGQESIIQASHWTLSLKWSVKVWTRHVANTFNKSLWWIEESKRALKVTNPKKTPSSWVLQCIWISFQI